MTQFENAMRAVIHAAVEAHTFRTFGEMVDPAPDAHELAEKDLRAITVTEAFTNTPGYLCLVEFGGERPELLSIEVSTFPQRTRGMSAGYIENCFFSTEWKRVTKTETNSV